MKSKEDLRALTKEIVEQAHRLSRKHTGERDAPVNYACIFAQSDAEFSVMVAFAKELGNVVDETPTGPVFLIEGLPTSAGEVRILKIRRPDSKRPERGDADFTVRNFAVFKEKNLGRPGFGLITRPNMEMIELIDSSFDVLAYYSHPTLADVLGIDLARPSNTRSQR